MRLLGGTRSPADDGLAAWLEEGYAPAYRTAFLILRNREDAEEAVQEAFLRAWRFRAAIPEGEGIRPWLYRVVVNSCLSKLRSDRRRRATGPFGDAPGTPEVADRSRWGDPETTAEDGELRRSLVDAVSALPEQLRVVVVLRYFAQLSEKEIASAIHRRPGTVKSRVHEAKALLVADPRLAGLRGEPAGERTADA